MALRLRLLLLIAAGICAYLIPVFARADASAAAQGLTGTTALNWSGYVADSGTYTSVSGEWTVPTIASDDGSSADATWVGIGGVSNHDLIQAGTEAVPDMNGGVHYQAWFEILPDASEMVPLAVHAGDDVKVSVTLASKADGTWNIYFDNMTTGKTYSTKVQYDSTLSSAEWIEEMPAGVGTPVSLDNFGSVAFSNGSAIV